MKKAQDLEITSFNIAISVVGKGQDFKILSSEEVEAYINPNVNVPINQGMEVI